MVNVPLPAYSDGAAVRKVVEAKWLPALEAFRPQMLFISAGFDAHQDDPLAQINLSEEGFAQITRRLMAMSDRHCNGRVVSVLEGGYNLRAMSRSMIRHLAEMQRNSD